MSLARRYLATIATAVALVLIAAGPAAAGGAPVLERALSGDMLTLRVTGPAGTGAWRVRVTSPNGRSRVQLAIAAGDMNWLGSVTVMSLGARGWQVERRISLTEALRGDERVAGCGGGACWDSNRISPPRNGNRRLALTLQLTREGMYTADGGARVAVEAFTLGPWRNTRPVSISH
jgi:hypothetical protein